MLFVGPSLDLEVGGKLFSGEVRPPAKRGDLDALMTSSEPPASIGIIDGQFLQEMAISPKEVVRAMDRGARLFGSSSIGALRAVECAPYGMVGIGRIFEMYLSGELDADDEVAITYDTETLRPLSEPMVNIRIAIQAALDAEIVSAAAAEVAIAAAKALYFPLRSYPNVLRVVNGAIDEAERTALADFLRSGGAPNQKQADALALIDVMQAGIAEGS